LGNKFDIKEFHNEVLKDGCLPLIILEKNQPVDKKQSSEKLEIDLLYFT